MEKKIEIPQESKDIIEEYSKKIKRQEEIKEKIENELAEKDEVEEIETRIKAPPRTEVDSLLRKRFYKLPKDISWYVENERISMQSAYIYMVLYDVLRYERAMQIKYNKEELEYIDISKNELSKKCNIKWNKTLDKFLSELENSCLIKIEKHNTKKSRFYLYYF